MRQYYVYELCAGRWRYIGMTSNVKTRLWLHRRAIAKHSEKPRPENWHQPLSEFPDPNSWEMRVLSGPFETKAAAIAEEERLQTEDWDNPGRVWENCGKKHSDKSKAKIKEAMGGQEPWNKGKTLSDETRAKMSEAHTGKKRSDETRAKIRETRLGKKASAETLAKMREATKEQWARKRAEKATANDHNGR